MLARLLLLVVGGSERLLLLLGSRAGLGGEEGEAVAGAAWVMTSSSST